MKKKIETNFEILILIDLIVSCLSITAPMKDKKFFQSLLFYKER